MHITTLSLVCHHWWTPHTFYFFWTLCSDIKCIKLNAEQMTSGKVLLMFCERTKQLCHTLQLSWGDCSSLPLKTHFWLPTFPQSSAMFASAHYNERTASVHGTCSINLKICKDKTFSLDLLVDVFLNFGRIQARCFHLVPVFMFSLANGLLASLESGIDLLYI